MNLVSEQWRIVASQRLDLVLFVPALALALIGYVLITSASMDVVAIKFNDPFYQSKRQLLFMILGSFSMMMCLMTPVHVWQKQSPYLLLLGMLLLVAVLIPGLGKNVNGSTRWIPVGPLSLQPSEFAKIAVVTFMAGYLVRQQDVIRNNFSGFSKSLVVLGAFVRTRFWRSCGDDECCFGDVFFRWYAQASHLHSAFSCGCLGSNDHFCC